MTTVRNGFNIKINELTQEQKDQRISSMSSNLSTGYIYELQVNYLWEQRQRLEKDCNCEITFSGGKMNAQNNWEVTVLCDNYGVLSLLDIKMINYQNELSNELQQPLGFLLVLKY